MCACVCMHCATLFRVTRPFVVLYSTPTQLAPSSPFLSNRLHLFTHTHTHMLVLCFPNPCMSNHHSPQISMLLYFFIPIWTLFIEWFIHQWDAGRAQVVHQFPKIQVPSLPTLCWGLSWFMIELIYAHHGVAQSALRVWSSSLQTRRQWWLAQTIGVQLNGCICCSVVVFVWATSGKLDQA